MDEPALIAAAKDGDREAFNQLVVTYQNLAYNVAYRIVGGPDEAADATQEAFISAYRGIARFRGGSFRSWLLRIVTNACYDLLRSKKRKPTTSMDDDPDQDWQEWMVDSSEQPDERAERLALGRLIQRGLDELSPEHRAVIVLADVQDMQYDEISTTLGISLGTVKSRLSRGRRKMRDYFAQHGELLPARYRLYDKAGAPGELASLIADWFADWPGTRWLGRE